MDAVSPRVASATAPNSTSATRRNRGSGGSVLIRAGALTVDRGEINVDNYGSGPGGKLLLRGDNQLALSNGTNVHSVSQANGSGAAVTLRSTAGGSLSADNSIVAVGSNGAGNSGKLVVSGGQVSLTNGAQLTSTAQSTGMWRRDHESGATASCSTATRPASPRPQWARG